MAHNKNKKTMERAVEINSGWTQDTVAKEVKFRTVTQTAYEAQMAKCAAKDVKVAKTEAQLDNERDERDGEYGILNGMSVDVREGVEGHEDYGNDSPLYGAMKFKRKSERASGLTRKAKDKDKDK